MAAPAAAAAAAAAAAEAALCCCWCRCRCCWWCCCCCRCRCWCWCCCWRGSTLTPFSRTYGDRSSCKLLLAPGSQSLRGGPSRPRSPLLSDRWNARSIDHRPGARPRLPPPLSPLCSQPSHCSTAPSPSSSSTRVEAIDRGSPTTASPRAFTSSSTVERQQKAHTTRRSHSDVCACRVRRAARMNFLPLLLDFFFHARRVGSVFSGRYPAAVGVGVGAAGRQLAS
jgi:hypothetical protein